MSADLETELTLARSLERKFEEITRLLYDTSIGQERLEAEVMPYVAAGVTFKDP